MKKMTTAIAALLICAATSAFAGEEDKAKVITITGNDTMRFDITAFDVAAGEKVKLVFKNIGKLPKQVMGHNLVILKKGEDVMAFATAGIGAGLAKEYIAPATVDKILAKTGLLGPGEEVTVEFKAPADKGDYPYVCTFPGHAALMKGIMKVK